MVGTPYSKSTAELFVSLNEMGAGGLHLATCGVTGARCPSRGGKRNLVDILRIYLSINGMYLHKLAIVPRRGGALGFKPGTAPSVFVARRGSKYISILYF
jgi:hypothetical protein